MFTCTTALGDVTHIYICSVDTDNCRIPIEKLQMKRCIEFSFKSTSPFHNDQSKSLMAP